MFIKRIPAAALIASPALAGPLTPPAGAVAPTGLTLQQVADQAESRIAINQQNTPSGGSALFEINQPGSYYLTGDVSGVSGGFGIRVNVPNVTIDLNGFAVRGLPGSTSGIFLNRADSSTIRNGSVSGWGNQGIRATNSTGVRLIDLIASDNVANGFQLGDAAFIYRCAALRNVEDGFNMGRASSIVDCQSERNMGSGIRTGLGSIARGCTTQQNVDDGISAGTGSSVIDCVSREDGVHGVDAASSCIVRGCNIFDSGTYGIDLSSFGTATGNSVSRAGTAGINVAGDCLAENNIVTGTGSVNPAIGIRVFSSDSRIQGNQLSGNATGILGTSSFGGSIFIGNALSGNIKAFELPAGNFVGPIVTPAATTAAIDGTTTSGSIGIGTTDPYANIVY
ncbi:MAG: right-handed parallel beta-helix repeat-containing protein [Planctomycetota bacterium]